MNATKGMLWFASLLSITILQGCGGSDDKKESSSPTTQPVTQQPMAPELNITGESDLSFTINESLLFEITNSGDPVTDCSISPALSQPLEIRKIGSTCVLSGVADAEFEKKNFTVTGSNDAGTSSVELSLEVVQTVPVFTSTLESLYQLQVQQPFELLINIQSANAEICTVSPELPIGLSIASINGHCVINGVPTEVSPSTSYTLAAENSGGTEQTSFNIQVEPLSEYLGDGPNPVNFDFVSEISEKDNPELIVTAVREDNFDYDSVLRLQSNGFPNIIKSIKTSSGLNLTSAEDIASLFKLHIDPNSGEVEVHLTRQLNFEQDAAFYELNLELGSESVAVLVRLYNVQNGTEAEPLTISNLSELRSFADGQFITENIGFDDIDLGENANRSDQNLVNLFISLDRDIDASASTTSPWEAFELEGTIDGNKHVIFNLTTADNGFIYNNDHYDLAKIKNIGFDNATFKSRFIYVANGELNSIYLTGTATPDESASLYFSPLSAAINPITRVYTNLYVDLGENLTVTRAKIGGIFGVIGSFFYLESAYSNGTISGHFESVSSTVQVGGIVGGSIFNYSDRFRPSLMYSAMKLDIRGNQGRIGVGGFGSQYLEYPEGEISSSDYQWRFVKDRGNPSIIRNVGNLHRDLNNDGIADENGEGPDISGSGISEAQLTLAETFTGLWIAEDSHFDIQEGEFPVLKGMPYPHTLGSSWLNAEDPGVAHQRATYNDYLTKP
ncbi:hypothetical protein JQC92_11295 [Shewanella sp. 202IG2-18]|uniref:hypothetical protein n=1 Tax=Parashewanella hymeniacidonis TaxID=2807618 RepID=UPI001961BDD5|nr:hypothetical protein [Parashewanella hymeniacidonis]MBM7072605.1 hypothetical protein [Parashewanella hymeniacidonis]